jgi:hypothetical protein
MKPTLTEIFWTQLTRRAIKWEPYFEVYEEYFGPWRDRSPVFVEVGVFGGGSLEMWTKYFDSSSQIWGVDNDPRVCEHPVPGATIVIGDQGDPQFWKLFLQQTPKIDLFLDDGGHRMNQQITTFECVWPKISDHGVYVVEDTHTSFWAEYGAVPGAETFVDYAKASVDVLHRNHYRQDRPNNQRIGLLRDLKSVTFFDSMVVFRKGRKSFDWAEVNGPKI